MSYFKGFDNVFSCFCWPCDVLWVALGLRPFRRSLVTRLTYIFMLIIFTLISMVFLTPSIRKLLLDERRCKKLGRLTCERLQGPAPVYRIFMFLGVYHVILAFLFVGVSHSGQFRARFQNHFWLLKILVACCSMLFALYCPPTDYSGEIWHFFGLNAAFAYLVIQFALLIDAAHSFNTKIVRCIEAAKKKIALVPLYLVLWIPTAVLYGISTAGTICLFRTYGLSSECRDNTFFIAFHVYMCVSATCISINPVVQEARPKTGLLQSSVATSYSTYVLWITLSNEPDDRCNPTREYLYPPEPTRNAQILVGLFITFTILIIFCVRNVKYPQYGKCIPNPGDNHQQHDTRNMETLGHAQRNTTHERNHLITEDELDGLNYSYAFFHVILVLATYYIMMTLTCWYRPEEGQHGSVKLIAGWGAVWIKLCGGIFSVFTYIWVLIAPVIFPGAYKELVFYDFLFVT